MSCAISVENFDSLTPLRTKLGSPLRWEPLFILPCWLEVWWGVFGASVDLLLCLVRQGDMVIGVAPLKVEGKRASFIGDINVCDYLDFVIAPGKEQDFFNVLIDHLKDRGINCLDLESLRPDSTVIKSLIGIANERSYKVSCRPVDVSLELSLPDTWDRYLETLTTKQRHEVRRKLRRLEEAGSIDYRVSQDSEVALKDFDTFIRLFRESGEGKANFMTPQMMVFFESLIKATARAKLLRLGFLELNTVPVAGIMYFDYNDNIYLYNSGYDPQYRYLSVGLMSKVLCIKDSIERGKKKFDFLKGGEVYKYRLGGQEVPLYRCEIVLH